MASALWRRRHENGFDSAEPPPPALQHDDGSLRLRALVRTDAEGAVADWWRYSTIGSEVSGQTVWHYRAEAAGAEPG